MMLPDVTEGREPSPPYWVLISVLFSSRPLAPNVAVLLCDAARRLYRMKQLYLDLCGDFATGRLTNLDRCAALGAITGPVFEAQLDLVQGRATVRFLLTHQGIALAEAEEEARSAEVRATAVWN